MREQIARFGRTVQVISRRYFRGDYSGLMGYLSKCIIVSGLGSNDYLNNYFMPSFSTSTVYTPKAFAASLLEDYSSQLTVRPVTSPPRMSYVLCFYFPHRQKKKKRKGRERKMHL